MREFKFRAWHKGAKQMLQNRDQGYQGEVFKWAHEGQPVEIMQFTGLHDKNGKDIYEGDILQDDCESLCSVVWENSSAQFLVEFEDETQEIDSPHTWAEIVGNIYENLELLTNGRR